MNQYPNVKRWYRDREPAGGAEGLQGPEGRRRHSDAVGIGSPLSHGCNGGIGFAHYFGSKDAQREGKGEGGALCPSAMVGDATLGRLVRRTSRVDLIGVNGYYTAVAQQRIGTQA